MIYYILIVLVVEPIADIDATLATIITFIIFYEKKLSGSISKMNSKILKKPYEIVNLFHKAFVDYKLMWKLTFQYNAS